MYIMLINCIMLLCKHRFRYRCVLHNTVIITECIGRTINWHAKHLKRISQRDKHIFCGTERNKFTSKTGGFNSILLFQKPNNLRILDVNNNSSVGLPGENISCVIRVNKA